MSEFNFGKCAKCRPLQALFGALMLESADIADEHAKLSSEEFFKHCCDIFTLRSQSEQVVLDINGQQCGSAEQFAQSLIERLRTVCVTRRSLNAFDLLATQNIVSLCGGLQSTEIQLPEEPVQTIYTCRSAAQIAAFYLRFTI